MNDLPTYDSIKQCSAHTGIPVTVIRQAKAKGCEAFKSNRIMLDLLLPWLFKQDFEDVDWGTELKRTQTKRERIRLSKDERSVIGRDEVTFALNKGMAALFQALDHKFSVILPPALKGLDEASIQRMLLAAVDEFKDSIKANLASVGASVGDTDLVAGDSSTPSPVSGGMGSDSR